MIKGVIYYGYVCPNCGDCATWELDSRDKSTYLVSLPIKICKKCGRYLVKIKCAKCGAVHDTVSVGEYCPDCGHQYARVYLRCRNCLEMNNYDHRYCTYCGQLLSRNEENWYY